MQETDITPDCVNYHFFKRNRTELTQLAERLSQSWHSVRSTSYNRVVETKKDRKELRASEKECDLLDWQPYNPGGEGTRTCRVEAQVKSIAAPVRVEDPLGR